MNIFGKKTDLENNIEKFKQIFTTENDIAEAAGDIWREWGKLENDYARELIGIKSRLDKVPKKFE